MSNTIKSSPSDSVLRASMMCLVSEVEKWEAHLNAFLTAHGSSALTARDFASELGSLAETINDIASIVRDSFSRALKSVRRHRNSFTPINTLPDEVLFPIFLEATQTQPYRKFNILITCSRWRDICSSNSAYWGQFHVPSKARHARRAIAAAQGRPLDITIDFRTWGAPLQEVVSQRTSTVRRLTARHISQLSKDRMAWLASSFPTLRELYMESGAAYTWGDCVVSPPERSQRKPLMVLSLLNCRFPYLKECYPGLRILSIIYHTSPVVEKEDSHRDRHLLDILRACPQLEVLTLCHPPMSTHEVLSAPPLHPIPLHLLRRLHLEIHVQKIASLLEAIETSPEALVSVDIKLTNMEHWAGHERSWHQQLLHAPLIPFSAVPAHSLPMLTRLDSFVMRRGHSVVGRALGYSPPSGRRTPVDFCITFTERSDDHDMRLAFDDFLSFLISRHFLGHVSRLRLEAFSSSQALQILRAAPHVKTLAMDAHSGLDVVKHLARTRGHSTRPVVADLEAIALVGCVIDDESLAELSDSVGSLCLRVLSLEWCESELEEEQIVSRLGMSGVDVRWVEDDPRREIRI